MLDLCLLGTGGMMPLPNRWLTSLLCKYNGSSVLIDCGEGTQIAIREKGLTFKPIDVICITHFHGDHISGLPGVLLAMANSERTEPLIIIGPRGVQRVVGHLRIVAPELPFEIRYLEITGDGAHFEMYGYSIDAFRLDHGMPCYGYTISVKRAGKFDVKAAEENNIPLKFWNRLQKGETVKEGGRTFTPDMVLGPERKGLKVTYATDSRPVKSISENAKNADLFICEGMYGEKSDVNNAVRYKHMTFEEAGTLAKEADAKELWLTHYSPALMRPDMYEADVQKIFPNAHVCRDGRDKTLYFEED